MGFLERLKLEKETRDARAREALEGERLERERRERTDEQRRQQELAKAQYHKARREQSERFRDESGIMNLLNEVEQLAENFQVVKYSEMLPIPLRDQDSNLIKISLGQYHDFGISLKKRGRYWKHSRRGFSVEVCPDGAIYVDGGSSESSAIPFNKWQENKVVLESALERAYLHPKTYVWEKYLPDDSQANRGYG